MTGFQRLAGAAPADFRFALVRDRKDAMANHSPPHPLPSAFNVQASVALTESGTNGELSAAITNRVVRLLRQHTRKGPTKAKTTMSGDLVVVALADCLTTAEKRLAGDGHTELVMQVRSARAPGWDARRGDRPH